MLNALVGALGLRPTLGGARVAAPGWRWPTRSRWSRAARWCSRRRSPGQIVPVDSEHSALAQCLRGGTADEVAKLVLTASGGPFRGWTAARPRGRHPRAGRRASHLVDGPDEHAELGVAGQQGPRADRDAPAVRRRLRPHRGRRAPAVDRALDGHVHRRLDASPRPALPT